MLKHLFIKKYPKESQQLFDGVQNWEDFNKNLHDIAESLKDYHEYLDTIGDGFEILIEGFIRLTENDKRFGISNYIPVDAKDDYGVDGYGDNLIGEYSAIQIKYRANPTVWLTASGDNLNSMVAEALHEGIIYGDEVMRHYIFTSAKGLNHKTSDNKFRGKVKCYGINDIKKFVDNNQNFWNNLRNLI